MKVLQHPHTANHNQLDRSCIWLRRILSQSLLFAKQNQTLSPA